MLIAIAWQKSNANKLNVTVCMTNSITLQNGDFAIESEKKKKQTHSLASLLLHCHVHVKIFQQFTVIIFDTIDMSVQCCFGLSALISRDAFNLQNN